MSAWPKRIMRARLVDLALVTVHVERSLVASHIQGGAAAPDVVAVAHRVELFEHLRL